jgi:hypothetical protein
VHNRGERNRIHLVVDCAVNEWLARMVGAGVPLERHAARPSGQEAFARFRDRVLEDESLQDLLRGVEDSEAFMARAVALGSERGFAFGVEEVRAAMKRGRQAWLAQWIV